MTMARWGFRLALSLLGALLTWAEPVWREASTLGLEGQGWLEPTNSYRRLPARAQADVPPSVWELSGSSAGLVVRFETTADRVSVRWTLTSESLAMPHMPATGVSGVDLYVREAGSRTWRFAQNGRPGAREGNQAELRLGPAGTVRQCLLYLPLYNGVRRVELGVEPGFELRPAPERPANQARPIVVYGTSIVQGGCASRPGLAYPAILGRRLERPVINLGFSGAGKMEPGVVKWLADLDPAVFVIDCLWNLSDGEPAEVERRVTHLVTTLRQAHPRTPVVLVGQSHFKRERHPTPLSQAQVRAAEALVKSGLTGVHWVDGAELLGTDGEGTVDGVHPNDLGMLRHAEVLAPVLERLLTQR
jgi:lysophospholipase L1-like esterase